MIYTKIIAKDSPNENGCKVVLVNTVCAGTEETDLTPLTTFENCIEFIRMFRTEPSHS